MRWRLCVCSWSMVMRRCYRAGRTVRRNVSSIIIMTPWSGQHALSVLYTATVDVGRATSACQMEMDLYC